MLVCLIQIISGLDSQSRKFPMFTLFSGRHVGVLRWYTNMAAPSSGLCKLGQTISTNIWSSGKRTDLKLREASSLSISYNITVFWLYPLNDFWIIFFLLLDCVAVLVKSWRLKPNSLASITDERLDNNSENAVYSHPFDLRTNSTIIRSVMKHPRTEAEKANRVWKVTES